MRSGGGIEGVRVGGDDTGARALEPAKEMVKETKKSE